jgi:hypothetical protein
MLLSRRTDFIMSDRNLKNITKFNFAYCLTDNCDHPDHNVGEEADPDDGAEEGEHEPALVFSLKRQQRGDFFGHESVPFGELILQLREF